MEEESVVPEQLAVDPPTVFVSEEIELSMHPPSIKAIPLEEIEAELKETIPDFNEPTLALVLSIKFLDKQVLIEIQENQDVNEVIE